MQLSLTTQSEADEIFILVQNCARHMKSNGIHQWDDTYPSLAHIQKDIEAGSMFSHYEKEVLQAIIVMDHHQSRQYANIEWKYQDQPILVVHRLAVNPAVQGRGLGKMLMLYAEQFAESNGFNSIRLDAYKHNQGLQAFYTNLGYEAVGEIALEYTAGPFVCFEKRIPS